MGIGHRVLALLVGLAVVLCQACSARDDCDVCAAGTTCWRELVAGDENSELLLGEVGLSPAGTYAYYSATERLPDSFPGSLWIETVASDCATAEIIPPAYNASLVMLSEDPSELLVNGS